MKTIDVKFTPRQDFKKLLVSLAEEIETFVASVIIFDRIRDFKKLLYSVAGIVKCGDKFKVATVRVFEQLGQDVETINALFHWGNLAIPAPVMALDFTPMSELGDIVGGCFNPQDDPKLVVHLN